MRCAICGSYATANLSGGPEGGRCESCLHETMALRRVVVGLMGSAKDRVAREMVQYIDHCMSTVALLPKEATLLSRLRAVLEDV